MSRSAAARSNARRDSAVRGGGRERFHGLSADGLRRLYRAMLRLRLVDERMLTLQRQGWIGFYGTATGEEAAVIGSGAALRDGDWVFPALRQGGVALLRGF